MSIPAPTHTVTCQNVSTIKSLGEGLDNVVASAKISIRTSTSVTYTDTESSTQYPVETGTETQEYTEIEYTSPLVPSTEELTEVTEGTEVFREALPKTKIGDVVTRTREVTTYDIPKAIVTTSEVEKTKEFYSTAEFTVEFDTSSISSETFVAYSDLTEEQVIGWARDLVPDTFTEAETKNAAKTTILADKFVNPDKYFVESTPLPW